MINLNAFVNALKSTWIRRLLLNESKWQELIKIHINLEMLTTCNVEYIQDILSTLNNQFWKDVLKSFLDINYETEIGEEQILKSPLFYNRNIKIDRKYVFYKTWYDKGIRFVNDLVNQNGSFYSYQEVGIGGSPLNILKYQGFIDSLKHFLSHTQIKLTKKVQDPFIPSHIKVFLQQKSGTQAMYNELNKNYDEPTSKRRWNEKFKFTDQEWKKIYNYPFSIIKYPAIQWFQTSINHNILVTNNLLFKMKIKNDSSCYYCHSQKETITHLFWTCERIQAFLKELVQWLNNNDIHCDFVEEFFIFGLDRLNIITKPLNIIILYAKYFIYTTRCNERQLVLEVYKKKLYQLFKILKDIALTNNELTEFNKDWEPYERLLNN